MNENRNWTDLIKSLSTQITATIGLISLIIGFVSLLQGNLYLGATVSGATVLIALLCLCIYVAFAKIPPRISGGKGIYRFESYRSWALVGIGFIFALIIGLFMAKPSQTFIIIAFLGTPTPTATPAGVEIIANPEMAAPTALPQPTYAKLAFEDYAWLDYPDLPVLIGAEKNIELKGFNLGQFPWTVLEMRLINSSDTDKQTIKVNILVESFTPITNTSSYTLTIDNRLAPGFLVPQNCQTDAIPSLPLAGFEPTGNILFGYLSTTLQKAVELKPVSTEADLLTVEPKDAKDYSTFIAAREDGIYSFLIQIQTVATDRSHDEDFLGPYSYAFLKMDTVLKMSVDHKNLVCQ